MKLYNTLSRKTEDFKPLNDKKVRVYSCGPTVYDHIHIGNLSAFIYADTLKRVLKSAGYEVEHVMNFTDVDDKTIRRSQEKYPEDAPEIALKKLTDEYKQIFMNDMRAIGNDTEDMTFVSAVDSIAETQKLITELHKNGFAYIADDGVYFSIEKYRKSGKKYGRLLELTSSSTSNARINNDEYDKESAHDFALWKLQKDNEPAWPFELDGHQLAGRPGWHIECSAMSVSRLGQPFDIHTGGVDLIFPHHENEIAQSTAGHDKEYAKFFVHNEHILVSGKKMSKSLNNFYILNDISEQYFDPIAFRLFVLSTHYQKQANYAKGSMVQAQFTLDKLQGLSDQRFQAIPYDEGLHDDFSKMLSAHHHKFKDALEDNMNTPLALQELLRFARHVREVGLPDKSEAKFIQFLELVDNTLGLKILHSSDINKEQRGLITKRDVLRSRGNFEEADKIRNEIESQNIEIDDTYQGTRWYKKRTR